MPGTSSGVAISQWLRPEERVVPFRSRAELDELREWCRTGDRVRARLVTGDGGAGKTRLAMRLCHEVEQAGWQLLLVRRGDEREAAEATQDAQKRCLVVVDYAETREHLAGMLNDVAAGDGPVVRVLLLARSSGEWWKQLKTATDYAATNLLEASKPLALGPVHALGVPEEVYGEALVEFAKKLGVDPPEAPLRLAEPDPVVLVVHAAALLAVADAAAGTPRKAEPATAEQVLESLLTHEARYWKQSADGRGLNLDLPELERVVTAGCLLGADSKASAAQMLSRIPELDNAERRRKVAGWLHDLYPPTNPDHAPEGEWIGPLRPDPVAERLVVKVLAEDPELIRRLFTGLEERQADKALTVLARAVRTKPEAVGLLSTALKADVKRLLVPAMLVAVETYDRLGELLADVLDAEQLPEDTLIQIANYTPSPSVALGRMAAIALQRLAAKSSAGPKAKWLADLNDRLSGLRQPDKALDAISEAVDIYRRLYGDIRVRLAKSLNNQSILLAELRRYQDALDVIEEAVRIYRELGAELPDAFRSDFADFLHTRSCRLAELGRRTEALTTITEAAKFYEQLADASPDDFMRKGKLADALNSQSMRRADLGERREALTEIERAVDIYRKLAGARPDAYLPKLADVLRTQSQRMTDLGQSRKALDAINEAVGIYKPLAEDHPNPYRITLAEVLRTQSERLADLGRHQEALKALDEAVGIYEPLAKDQPDTFQAAGLADVLHTRSYRLADLGRHQEAMEAINEAVRAYRQLAGASRDFKAKLANALNSQSIRLAELERYQKALEAINEAVGIHRDLEQELPGPFRPDLAISLNKQSMLLAKLERYQKALNAIEEAVQIYEELGAKLPGAFRAEVARSLNSQSMLLAKLERYQDALDAIERAVPINRDLANEVPGVFRSGLADALQTRAHRLHELGRNQEARDAIMESVYICQELADESPNFTPKLENALRSLSQLSVGPDN
jgi:tetratricopeptide (TPR) repeat protein